MSTNHRDADAPAITIGISAATVRVLLAAALLGSVCTLAFDVAAGFWSPGLSAPFHERLGNHGAARLWLASFGNLYTMPLHLAGMVLLYLALRPAGAFWALGPTILLGALLMTYPQFIHSAWWFVGIAGADGAAPQSLGQAATIARYEAGVRDALGQFRIATVIASVWMVIPIFRGQTLLPRHIGLVPLVLIPALVVWLLGLIFDPVPPALVHLLGGPFILMLLYIASGRALLRFYAGRKAVETRHD